MTMAGKMNQYQVLDCKTAIKETPNPKAYRMIIFAPNPIGT